MKLQIVTARRIGVSNTALKVLLCTLVRLPILNTYGCNMEMKDGGSRTGKHPRPEMSGACAPMSRQACLAGSRPESGLPLSLAVTHRKALKCVSVRNACAPGRDQ
jgi:hypothetical protein